MPVRYVIADPEPPTWWARNKAWFCTVVGLLIGLYIGAGGTLTITTPAPDRSTSTRATSRPTPGPTASELPRQRKAK